MEARTNSIYWHSVFRLLSASIYVWLQFSTAIDSIDYVPGIRMGDTLACYTRYSGHTFFLPSPVAR
jgi:acyl-ACP thioesterase